MITNSTNDLLFFNFFFENIYEAGIVLKKKQKSTEDEIIKHCINYLGKFKSPDRVYFLDELPKGSSGKIQRLKIKELI